MTGDRFQQIERLVEEAGRCLDPVTGCLESLEENEDVEAKPDPKASMGLLGITANECAKYVQRRMRKYARILRSIVRVDQPARQAASLRGADPIR